MLRTTSKRPWDEVKENLSNELGYSYIWKRLAMIEDVLGDDYNLERLKELVEADKEGRCAILPCKNWLDIVFGDQEIFYAIDDEDNAIKEITVNSEERFEWYRDYTTITIIGRDEKGNYFGFSPEEIGEDVFLTFEEAKEKLNK